MSEGSSRRPYHNQSSFLTESEHKLTPLILFSLPGTAGASTFDIDFYIKSPAPVNRQVINRTFTYNIGPGWAETTVPSTWSYVTCGHKNGVVYMRFVATASNWPTSWPATVSCSSGGYTLRGTVKDLGLTDDYPVEVDLTSGLDLELDKGAAMWRDFEISSAFSFVDGQYAGDLGGTTWQDVSCMVWSTPSSQQFLRIYVGLSHLAGLGTCSLPKVGGGVKTLPVQISRP